MSTRLIEEMRRHIVQCHHCGGSGTAPKLKKYGFPCEFCQGAGEVIEKVIREPMLPETRESRRQWRAVCEELEEKDAKSEKA